MVAANARVNAQNVIDPRYQNADFRRTQAERYLDFFLGITELSAEEHNLIPRLCYWDIKKVSAWRGLTRVEQLMFKISNPVFSRIPNNTSTTMKIVGASVITMGALMVSAYTRNDKIVGLAMIGFLAVLYKEVYSKK